MTTDVDTLLNPKNDFVFKKLFVESLPSLTDLINAIRHPEAPIEVVEILNPRIEPDELLGKYIVLDILARDGQGHFYNVEMQVRRRPDWSARSVYYMAKALAEKLKSGGAYSTLQPVIGIHLLDFELFTDDQQAHQALWCFELRDRTQPAVCVGREIQLNIIELPKADRLGVAAGDLAAWVAYFKHWQEEAAMNQIIHPPVRQALANLKMLSGNDDTRRLAFVRERALRDEISELQGARREGWAEGMEQGMEKGMEKGVQQGAVLILERLLVKRFGALPEEIRRQLAQARPEQLETWTERLLDAATLNAVFESH
jgi:predicted transposase/invertase (TIGR01784 family)